MSRKKQIGVLFAMAVVIQMVFSFHLIPRLTAVSGQTIFDMQWYDGPTFYKILEAYGEAGLLIYNKIQILDMLYIVVYGLFFLLILQKLNARFVFIPLMGVAFDIMENVSIRLSIIYKLNFLASNIYILTTVKFLCFIGSLFYVIILTRRCQKRKVQ